MTASAAVPSATQISWRLNTYQDDPWSRMACRFDADGTMTSPSRHRIVTRPSRARYAPGGATAVRGARRGRRCGAASAPPASNWVDPRVLFTRGSAQFEQFVDRAGEVFAPFAVIAVPVVRRAA